MDTAERSDNQPQIRCVSRRTFLALAGSTTSLVALAACGGATAPAAPKPAAEPTKPAAAPAGQPAASPAAAGAPAAAPAASPAVQTGALPNLKGTTLSVLQWSNFIPELDPFYKKQIEEGFMKETGAVVNMENINQNDLAAKIAAAIQTGSGPDLIMQAHNWAHLFKDSLVDVTEVVADVKKITGDFYPQVESYTNVGGGKYMTVPHDFVGTIIHWRKSWFREVGYEMLPTTFDEWHAAGRKLKEKGHPLGQCLGHSLNDPNLWCYPMLWAYGAREVDEQGKVAINSPETIAAVKAMKDSWQPAYDETGLAWDDSSNNRAFLAETISATLNGASIWWVAKNQDKKPWLDDIGLDLMLTGPKGRFSQGPIWSYGIMKYSKNVEAAKAFIRWSMQDSVWMPWFEVAGSFHNGVGPKQNNNPLWTKFPPSVQVFKDAPVETRGIGWPGPADQKAAVALSKFIVVDMFAKAVQGDSPESAVAWAENEYKQIYT